MEISMDEGNRAMIAIRKLNAPRSMVYQMFTSVDHIDKWYGPKGCYTVTSYLDLREGGIWKYTMNMPNGSSFEAHHVFLKLMKDEKIVFNSAPQEDAPEEQWFTTEIDLKDDDEGTEIKITMSYRTDEMYAQAKEYGAIRGYVSAVEKLEEYVATL